MATNVSYGASWADQWDNGPDPDSTSGSDQNNKDSAATKYKHKVGVGLGKTKSAASNGIKKVKEGTTLGFHWIKSKYQKKTTQNN